jgi:hypothetical protein
MGTATRTVTAKARNKARAKRAEEVLAMATYLSIGEDRTTALVDLLTDLRHYCGQKGLDFNDAVGGSAIHYAAELEGE